jgi:N6-L-threonylcarbamoyladenine synthase
MSSVRILAIESSCDDTSAAVIVDGKVLSNHICTQKVHEQYGGVVPELASRDHQKNIVPVVEVAMKQANISWNEIDAVACTTAPGLIGSLLIGVSFAKGLALSLNKPLIAVNHMKAHVMANFLNEEMPAFPFLCLTVSGGHTQIVLVKDYLDMEVIGETTDDAAGEAFDKTAKILGLPYPGGPLIDKYAVGGDPKRFKFPEPKIPGYDFSFSGLKTAILYFIQEQTALNPNFVQENLNDICASIQERIVSILMNKLKKAATETGVSTIAIAGGVSANTGLRWAANDLARRHRWKLHIPEFQYCTDNAGMIAIAAHHLYLKNEFAPLNVAASSRAH